MVAQVMQSKDEALLNEDEDAENAGRGGCGLGGNLDVAVCRSEWYFHLGAYQARMHLLVVLASLLGPLWSLHYLVKVVLGDRLPVIRLGVIYTPRTQHILIANLFRHRLQRRCLAGRDLCSIL